MRIITPEMNINIFLLLLTLPSFFYSTVLPQDDIRTIITELDRARVVNDAEKYLLEEPLTITSFRAERSSGGIHDYYSEGDYWWPDPDNPDGPYIRRDGQTNPGNFTVHREALRRFSIQTAVLTAAYKFTGEKKYADHAVNHLLAWFCNKKTLMNPNLRYAQAIKGISTGRGIGIIDTIHLVEVVQALIFLENSGMLTGRDLEKIKGWFLKYNQWLTTDQFGIDERDNGNNHSTCWNMQVAQFAKFTHDQKKTEYCRNHFKQELLPKQMADNGSFPLELKRTKPYGYSLFNLDAMIMVVKILSVPDDNLWAYTSGGKNIKTAVDFIFPYIKDKNSWPYEKDIMYFDNWPVRQPSLLFAGLAYNNKEYIELWKTLDPSSDADEIIRNYFIRQPILWID